MFFTRDFLEVGYIWRIGSTFTGLLSFCLPFHRVFFLTHCQLCKNMEKTSRRIFSLKPPTPNSTQVLHGAALAIRVLHSCLPVCMSLQIFQEAPLCFFEDSHSSEGSLLLQTQANFQRITWTCLPEPSKE